MQYALGALILFVSASAAYSQSIDVTIISAKDETSSFGEKKEQCELGFEITNNSWGTLYRINVPLNATDDRGRGVDELLVASANNSNVFTWVPIAKGETVKVKGDATFKEACKYIESVSLDGEIDDKDCAIRMMPEQASCSDVVTLRSKLENIKASD